MSFPSKQGATGKILMRNLDMPVANFKCCFNELRDNSQIGVALSHSVSHDAGLTIAGSGSHAA